MVLIGLAILGFILGSIPFSLILARWYRSVDVREYGLEAWSKPAASSSSATVAPPTGGKADRRPEVTGGSAQHLYGILLFLLSVFGICLSNLLFLRRMSSYSRCREYPMAFVLVPARNEEDSIRSCVESLLEQDYPHFEVLVLDGDSTDGTGG